MNSLLHSNEYLDLDLDLDNKIPCIHAVQGLGGINEIFLSMRWCTLRKHMLISSLRQLTLVVSRLHRNL